MRVAGSVRLLVAAALFVLSPAMLGLSWGGRARVDWDEPYVNVRAGPSLGATKIGRLARGAEGEVLEEQGEWVRIRYPGGEGWVVDRSLRRLLEPASDPGDAGEAPPIEAPPPEATVEPGASVPAEAASGKPNAGPESAPLPTPPGPAAEEVPSLPREGYLSGLDQPPVPPVEPGAGLVSMLSGLLLVLALLAGLVWVGRRLLGHRFPSGRRGSAIRVLATRALGPRQGLLLAEAGGLVWLLAQGPDGVRLIAEIRDEAALRRLNEQYGFRDTPFEAELRRHMDLAEEPAGPQADREPSPEERLAALRRRPKPGEPS